MSEPTVNFGNLYDYADKSGIVLPQTDDIKENIELAFKQTFGDDFSVSEETPAGRLIEALTMLFVDVLGVNAQNANSFNVRQAFGSHLDALGIIFGIARLANESDSAYRDRILQSQSPSTGYVQSIRNSISKVNGVVDFRVFENGESYPVNIPNGDYGVQVPRHSMFASVIGGSDVDVATAIYNTRSAGCGFKKNTVSEVTPTAVDISATDVDITDSVSGASTTIYFYRPIQLSATVSIIARNYSYTGISAEDDIKSAVVNYANSRRMCFRMSEDDIIAAVAAYAPGIVPSSAHIIVNGNEYTELNVTPFRYLAMTNADVTVTLT